jgi:hypothetical protein
MEPACTASGPQVAIIDAKDEVLANRKVPNG